jgi:geranylgeranyl diphosphate synthase type I
MIGRKTAALVGASVQAGAILATDDPDTIEAYRHFGYHLGLAFQMADDVKGSFWTSAASGKPEAGDIRKRKKTLPLVWALEHASGPDRARLAEIYAIGQSETDEPMPPDQVDEVLAILERSGAREQALVEARRYRDLAVADIAKLPIGDRPRIELRALVESVIAL